ncbi:MAG: polyhydroxyalkanoic acid system family protein [Pirellulaceae bacterium]
MPEFLTAVDHSLGKESAKTTLSSFMDEALQTYGDSVDNVQSQWNDHDLEFSFKAMGMTVSGKLIVTDDAVTVKGKIPFALSMFRGKIERTMEDELRKALQ